MFAKQTRPPKPKELKPEILTHPHIPKPLHGLNPRTVLGKKWWDDTRFKAQQAYGYKCAACGVPKQEAKKHQWLEGHEYWDINYKTGICEVKEIVPLCHYCHNFIHSGRLLMIMDKYGKPKREVIEILKHGFKILKENNLKCFPGTLAVANELGVLSLVDAYEFSHKELSWDKYKMKLEGVLYDSLFESYEDWFEYYSGE